MRIGVLTTSYPRTEGDDAGIFVKRLVQGFVNNGCEGIVIVPRDSGEPKREVGSAFSIFRFCGAKGLVFGAGIPTNVKRRPLYLLKVPSLLLGFMFHCLRHRRKYDILLCNWFITAIPAWIISKITHKPYVVVVRGSDAKLLRSSLGRALLVPAINNAKQVISVGKELAHEVESFDSSISVKVIENGAEPSVPTAQQVTDFKERALLQFHGPMLLFVGTVAPVKRIELLIEALDSSDLITATLVICGRDEDVNYATYLKNRAQELGVSERIRFEGQVAPKVVPLYLSAADVVLSASEHEGRPNALLEALALGCRIAASDIPAHREIFADKTNARLFSNVIDARRKISELLNSPKAAPLVEKTWKQCASEYLDLFSDDSDC